MPNSEQQPAAYDLSSSFPAIVKTIKLGWRCSLRVLNSKGLATAARGISIWVVELEATTHERITIVQLHPEQIQQRLGITNQLHVFVFHHCKRNSF
jgi:hypothetical protein